MKPKLKIVLPILVFLMIIIPLGVYSAIMEDNLIVPNNSSVSDNNSLSVIYNNNLSQNKTQLLDVPDVKQPSNYTSGPASLQAVLDYYGMDMMVDDLINITNTTPVNGTLPENIAQTARNLGFSAEIKQNMTLEELQENINQEIPVIIDAQVWKSNNTTGNLTADQLDGHYMVVIGIDNENVYFEDPAVLGSRGYMTNQEFLDRWYAIYPDPDNNGTNITTNHLGIIITGKEAPARPLIIKIN